MVYIESDCVGVFVVVAISVVVLFFFLVVVVFSFIGEFSV